jgi:hypothetical protein
VMLLPRELDPVEAGRNMPLPPERPAPGIFAQFGVGTMIDPTAEDVPLPEPKPAARQPDANANSKSNARRVR